ncbi:MAG TPA: RNA methyltransferase substrate-binding domain-containing protein, partial [Thermodesulfobacteriota bacterium]
MRTVYGVNPVLEALRASVAIDRILISEGRTGKASADILRLAREKKIEVSR